MTIDSKYFLEVRQPKPIDDVQYYYEFETAEEDSAVEVYVTDVLGYRIKLVEVAEGAL